MEIFNKMKEILDRSRRPLITAHVRPDGDALGAEVAFYHVLKNMGKEPRIINDSPVAKIYKFMTKKARVEALEKGPTKSTLGGFDCVIVVDTPNGQRLGRMETALSSNVPVINIDHHICSENFGTVNWIDTTYSSAGEMVLDFFSKMNLEVTPDIAEALYVAIITDTGRFTHSNTDSRSLRAAAYLVDKGADPSKIGEHLYKAKTFGQLLLVSMTTRTLTLHAQNRVASMLLTQQMLEEANTASIDTQELADIPASIEGVNVGVLVREIDEPGIIKVSLRSKGGFDVNRIAKKFGGGGHERAAGFETPGELIQVRDTVVGEIEKVLAEEDATRTKEGKKLVPT